MHRTRIKFCGFTQPADAVYAAGLGVDEIGLVFAGGPRHLEARKASEIAAALRAGGHRGVTLTGLFMDPDPDDVETVLEVVELSRLQFHGRESAGLCARFGLPWTKAIGAGAGQDLAAEIRRWRVAAAGQPAAVVVDAHQPGERGGQGKTFDWNRLPAEPALPIYLAGGLSADNVARAVIELRPYAVDVSSGIEDSPGIKNHATMQRFIDEVRRADAQIDGQTG